MPLSRREFIIQTATFTAALSTGLACKSVEVQNGMPYRMLGKTGLKVSLLNLGGHAIGVRSLSEKQSIEIMRTAVDEGINFFDNAWEYNEGRSEELMGKALRDGYRNKVVLMTKHHGREPKRAQVHLEDSLRRLQTDVIDIWQFHELDELHEIDDIYNSGVLDFALKAKEQGKIKHIGFTGHYRPDIHLEMINRGFEWETVQIPVNILDHHYLSFTQNVLPVAVEKNIGVIGMKSLGGMGNGFFKTGKAASVEDCIRFSMSMPISTLCSGIDSMKYLKENISIARNFTPMTQEEIAVILEKSLEYSKDGEHEWYKTYETKPDDNW